MNEALQTLIAECERVLQQLDGAHLKKLPWRIAEMGGQYSPSPLKQQRSLVTPMLLVLQDQAIALPASFGEPPKLVEIKNLVEAKLWVRSLAGWAAAKSNEQRVAPSTAAASDTSLDARAVSLKVQHPDWTDTRIARALGCQRTSLYKANMPNFKLAKAAQEAARGDRQRGTKFGGNVDATDE